MATILLFIFFLLGIYAYPYTVTPATAEEEPAALFKKHCSACHPNAAKIPRDTNIMKILRDPPPFMPRFDKEKLSDSDARKIEHYI
jgi:mono/diheme cytochrome c family protein